MGTDVMIVEDECDIAAATLEYLEAAGLTARHVTSAEEALRVLPKVGPRVILLDVNLPAMNGFTFCRTVRARAATPIIFVSARGSDDDQILALSVGGDDYVTKPISLAVLLAKVRRALDRSAGLPEDEPTSDFDDGRLRVEEATGRTWLGGEELHLTTIEASW